MISLQYAQSERDVSNSPVERGRTEGEGRDHKIRELIREGLRSLPCLLYENSYLDNRTVRVVWHNSQQVWLGSAQTQLSELMLDVANPSDYPGKHGLGIFFVQLEKATSYTFLPLLAVEPAPVLQLLTQLEALRGTPEEDRWPDAIWPTDQAFEEAGAFIRQLPLFSLPMPDMGLAEDGEINFLWEDDSIEIDLGFYGTRPCSYFARDKRDGRKMHGADFEPSDGLPDELEALLTS